MRLRIAHTTTYRHSGPVGDGLMELRMQPHTEPLQTVVEWHIHLNGAEEQVRFSDQNENVVMLTSFIGGTEEVSIRCEGIVDTVDRAGISGEHRGCAPLWFYKRPTALTQAGVGIRALAREAKGETHLARLHDLSARIREAVTYEIGETDARTQAEDALKLGKGVCQDHAQIFIAAARHIEFPCRYVSGYLMMNDRVEQEAGHAWAEAFIDGLGWVGFDVSNGISPDERYVRIAAGRDYLEAAPIRGLRRSTGNVDNELLVHIEVQQ